MQLNFPKTAGVAVSLLFGSVAATAHVFTTSKTLSFEDYADAKHVTLKSVKNQFSASGKLVCPAYTGTAQVTGSANILTTAAHLFYDKTCKQVAIERCTFEPLFSHDKYHLVAKGSHIGPCVIGRANTTDDWAAVYVDRPVRGVTPYKVPDLPVSIDVDTNLTVVSASARSISHSPFIVECRVRDRDYYPNMDELDDCSSNNGSSGSAQLVPGSSGWILFGLIANTTDGDNLVEYDRSKFFTAAKSVGGELWATLQRMTKEGDIASLRDSLTRALNSRATQYFAPTHNANNPVAAARPAPYDNSREPRPATPIQSGCDAVSSAGSLDESLEMSFMGMIVAPITVEGCGVSRRSTGAMVIAVAPMTPAEAAGFNTRDVIVKWGDEPIITVEDLKKAMSQHAGSTVSVEIVGVNGNGKREIALPNAQ